MEVGKHLLAANGSLRRIILPRRGPPPEDVIAVLALLRTTYAGCCLALHPSVQSPNKATKVL